MGDDNRRTAHIVKKTDQASGYSAEIFAAGAFELPQTDCRGITGPRRDLGPRQPLPFSEIDLLQPVVDLDGPPGTENKARGVAGAALWTAEHGHVRDAMCRQNVALQIGLPAPTSVRAESRRP